MATIRGQLLFEVRHLFDEYKQVDIQKLNDYNNYIANDKTMYLLKVTLILIIK